MQLYFVLNKANISSTVNFISLIVNYFLSTTRQIFLELSTVFLWLSIIFCPQQGMYFFKCQLLLSNWQIYFVLNKEEYFSLNFADFSCDKSFLNSDDIPNKLCKYFSYCHLGKYCSYCQPGLHHLSQFKVGSNEQRLLFLMNYEINS